MSAEAPRGGRTGKPEPLPRVVVVGAGITGLAAAYRLLTGDAGKEIEVVVLEASVRAGGKLMPVEVGGMPLEGGADSFVMREPWATDLCRDLGLQDQVITPGASGAFVWARGRLLAYPEQSAFGIPSDVDTLIRWPGLSPRGRIRAAMDLYRKPRGEDADESVGDLLERRLGRECAEVLVGPLLAGIHASDARKLSVRATFPELEAWERGHGSLIRASRAARRTARETGNGPLFGSIRGGLGRLTERLVEAIRPDRVRMGTACTTLRRTPEAEHEWEVFANGEPFAADGVVLAGPAFESARLLSGVSARAASSLSLIPYVSSATVALVYPKGTASRLPEATGFVVPPSGPGQDGRPRTVTACTWVSRKWPDTRFEDRAVVRAFVGRAGEQDALSLGDEELATATAREVEAMSAIGAEPESWAIVRWDRAMPQYEVGHLERVKAAREALASDARGLIVAGSAYRGVGIADCARQAAEAAEQIRAHVVGRAAGAGRDRTEAVSWTT